MGLYDRDYYHDDEDTVAGYFGARGRSQRMMLTNIIVVTVVFWIADNVGTPGWLTQYLRLEADLLRQPWEFYRLFTYGLTHSRLNEPGGLFHILFNMFVLWMFGREVEWRYGRWEFLRFYAAAIAASGLVWALIRAGVGDTAATAVGASGGVTAVVFVNIVNWPRRQVALWGVWRMPAWQLGVLLVGLDLIMGLLSDKNIAYEAHLAGAAFGAAYAHFGWSFARWGGWDLRRLTDRFKPRPKLKVHDPETYYRDLDAECDALLEKILHHGEESLTEEERRKLEDYSRRMRQKHR